MFYIQNIVDRKITFFKENIELNTSKTPSNDQITAILENSKTIAVIGSSSNPYRTSFHIAQYLQQQGYGIIPINPNEKEVLGEKVYNSILDIPDSVEIGVIDIFRNKEFTHEMLQEIAEWSDKTGQKPLVWTQLDVSNTKAEEIAEENELPYVKNKCLMVEHRNLVKG